MTRLLLLALLVLVGAGTAHADIARKCKDASFVFSQTAGCVKRPPAPKLSATDTYLIALDVIEQDPKRAFGLFEKACKERQGAACAQVAMMYESGRGRVVAKDQAKANGFNERACDLGEGRACQKRGNAASNTADYALAFRYFERGCAKDDGIACAQQAWYVEKGHTSAADPVAARKLYDKALRLIDGRCPGSGLMCWVRGYLYEKGIGVAVDPAKVLASFQLACAESYGDGCGALGRWLEGHGGSPADVITAFAKACELEVADACSRAATRIANAEPSSARPLELAERGCRLDSTECGVLAELYRLGRGTQRDQERATAGYKAACDAGDQSWCYTYGRRLHDGIGIAADTARARIILDGACTAQNSDACTSLGLYVSGDKTDDARAYALVSAGCKLGSAHGCYVQGWMIARNRRGGATQEAAAAGREALPLYEAACSQGSVQGCDAAGDVVRPDDAARALGLFRKGCDAEGPSGPACGSVAAILAAGEGGVAKDLPGAIRAAARACAHGEAQPCDWLPGVTTDATTIALAVTELEPACKAGTEGACFAQAMVTARTGATDDKKRAAAMFIAGCQRKHVPSCEIEAQITFHGIGVPEDKVRGEQLYRGLCDGDVGSACLALAQIALQAKDAQATLRFADRACSLGSADGCSTLGFLYYTAQLGIRWDIAQGATFFTKACELGSGLGCANQAELVRFGINGPADPAKAFTLYTKSCEAGQHAGCAGAALYLARGDGGATKDLARAQTMFRAACTADVAEACVELAALLEAHGGGTAPEIARMRLKALDITEKEAATNPAYMYWLGVYHQTGMATVKDPARALSWFGKACEGFDPLGCIAAGKALTASSAPADREKARVYFQRACAAGVEDGCRGTSTASAAPAAPPVARAPARGCGEVAPGGGIGLAALVLAGIIGRRRRQRRAAR